MIHQGKLLKQQIKLSGRKVDSIAKEVGVVRTTIYEWYKLEVLSNDVLDRLEKAGINLTFDGRQMSFSKSLAINSSGKPYYSNINTSAGLSSITDNVQVKASGYIDVPNSGADFFINIFGDSMYPKYCAGIRFGDLARLKHSMCKNARLQYEMHKTKNKKKERNVLLLDQAKKIIKKYSKNKPYIFPLNINWGNEEQSINSENTRLNKYLKKACKKADIPQLTFHTSRNTFADIAVKKNTGTRQLKELFGHSKESTTEIYMSDFYQEETDDALKNIFEK